MDWNDVADQIGISPESLRAIRKGRNGPKEITARALDDWLSWEPGSTERLFDGGEPVPLDTDTPAPASPVEESLQQKLARAHDLISEGTRLLEELRQENQGQ